MKKTLHYSIKILSVLTFCFFTYAYTAPVLYAQNTQTDYTVLAPLPGTTNSCPTGTDCTTNFKTYLEGMFTFAIGVSAVLAFIMLSFAGFQYVTTDGIGEKSNARERINNAVYGLLLVIGAYAILYTINPDILNFNLNIIRPNISSTDTGIDPNAKYGNGKVVPGYPLNDNDVAENGAIYSKLNNAGVFINAGPCKTGGTQGCTNLVYLPDSAINGVIDLYNACNKCYVQITGGAEGGHVEHGKGNPVVDLNPSSDLNKFLVGNKAPYHWQTVPKTINGKVVNFRYEVTGSAPHWHVVF